MLAPLRQPRPELFWPLIRQLHQQVIQLGGWWGCRFAGFVAALAGAAAAQQFVELVRHQLPVRVQVVQEGAVRRHGAELGARPGRLMAWRLHRVAQRPGDPVQVVVAGRQHMGLLVVEVLDAVLGGAQKVVSRRQRVGGALRHQPGASQILQRDDGAARAQLWELPATYHLQQLHREFDLADAAARHLHVVGAFGVAGTAAGGVFADLFVQHPQRVKHVVVQVTAEHERQHRSAQRLGRAIDDGGAGGHHPAFEPGKAFPLTALGLEIVVQRRQRHGGGPRVAVRAQRQVHAKHKPVLGGLANQRVNQLDLGGKVLVVGDAALARHQRLRAAGSVAIVVVDVDQVDVAGDIELSPAQLAHAHHPQLGALAVRAQRRTVQCVQLG